MLQRNTWRKQVEDRSDVESIIDWNGRREGYGLNVLEATVLIESSSVKLKNPAGNWY